MEEEHSAVIHLLNMGDNGYLGNTGTFALSYTLPYHGAVLVLVTAMRTLNLMLVIQHPNNTCHNNQNATYTVFSSMSVLSSQVALLLSEHCSAVSLFVFFPQHERPLQNTRYNHSFVYFNTDVS